MVCPIICRLPLRCGVTECSAPRWAVASGFVLLQMGAAQQIVITRIAAQRIVGGIHLQAGDDGRVLLESLIEGGKGRVAHPFDALKYKSVKTEVAPSFAGAGA